MEGVDSGTLGVLSVQNTDGNGVSVDKGHKQPLKSWTNPRKRPYRQDSGTLFNSTASDGTSRARNLSQDLHLSKRSRGREWPLKNSDHRTTTHDNDSSNNDEKMDKRSSSNSMRPSKFCEGSMNDKISQRPPSLYTRQEEAMEQYVRSQDTQGVDMNYDAGIEPQKPSGVFRFGKAIANALKPLTVWSGRNGMWKDKEKERIKDPEKNILRERQAKAVEAYAELKRNNYKGTQTSADHESQGVPPVKPQDAQNQAATSFRDSGIDMELDHNLYEHKPNDQLIGSTDALLVPPTMKFRSVSPFSDASSARKSSLHIPKPSFQGLKKVASQIHLSPAKRQSEAPLRSSLEEHFGAPPTVPAVSAGQGFALRREPSKKDIAKQCRLGKKVSDLENKLETARRELELSMSDAPPVPDLPAYLSRKSFTPGALPSLPSEGNMSPQKDGPTYSAYRQEIIPSGETSTNATLKPSISNIALKAEVFKPGSESDDVLDLEAATGRKRRARPVKSYENNLKTPTGVHKRLPKVSSKTPRNSPLSQAGKHPPIPAVVTIVQSEEDLQPATLNKVTDHTSVSHLSRAPSPFLGPPASASPMRTRSKTKRGISPPPSSLVSPKKLKSDVEVTDTHTHVEKNRDANVKKLDPNESTVPQEPPQKLDVRGQDTFSHATRKDEFEWPEDVF